VQGGTQGSRAQHWLLLGNDVKDAIRCPDHAPGEAQDNAAALRRDPTGREAVSQSVSLLHAEAEATDAATFPVRRVHAVEVRSA
jgi:hypothetical protein